MISRFSSLLYEARYPRLWLPVITTHLLASNGSITMILSWMIAWALGDDFNSSECQYANSSLMAEAATTDVSLTLSGLVAVPWNRRVSYCSTAFGSVAAP